MFKLSEYAKRKLPEGISDKAEYKKLEEILNKPILLSRMILDINREGEEKLHLQYVLDGKLCRSITGGVVMIDTFKNMCDAGVELPEEGVNTKIVKQQTSNGYKVFVFAD